MLQVLQLRIRVLRTSNEFAVLYIVHWMPSAVLSSAFLHYVKTHGDMTAGGSLSHIMRVTLRTPLSNIGRDACVCAEIGSAKSKSSLNLYLCLRCCRLPARLKVKY